MSSISNAEKVAELCRVAKQVLEREADVSGSAEDLIRSLDEWIHHPQLYEFGLLVARAWVELEPESLVARRALGEFYAELYLLDEGIDFEGSGIPWSPASPVDATKRMQKVRELRLLELVDGGLDRVFELDEDRARRGNSVFGELYQSKIKGK